MDENPVSPALVYELLQLLRADVMENHKRIRTDMTSGFERLSAENHDRGMVCQEHHGRLVALETLASMTLERKTASRGTLAIMVAGVSAAVVCVSEWVKYLLGWR